MKIRALALGAAIGFVVAFAPSCSGTKCGPQNCDGCCDTKGTCVKKPSNNNNTTCGAAGNACVDCAASGATCNSATSQCTSGGGGGTGGGTGGGGGSTCDGCLLPPAGTTCVPRQNSATNVANCGIGGGLCVACGAGQNCDNGSCVTPDAGTAGIGAACNLDTDCNITLTAIDRQAGVKAYCKKNAIDLAAPNATGVAFPGGFCTKRCGFEDNSCGAGSTCLISLGFIGHYENMCFKNCTAPSDCRAGYDCIALSSTINLCLPLLADGGAPEVQDAGPGRSGPAGSACADDTACQPPATGTCLKATLPDGGSSGYTDGQCTAECGAVAALTIGDAWCGAGGSCNAYGYNVGDGLGPFVLWQCDQSCGADAGTCRTGYVCDNSAQFPSCVPNCNNVPGFCGTGTCNATSGLCQ